MNLKVFRPIWADQIFVIRQYGNFCYTCITPSYYTVDIINFVLYYLIFTFGGCLITLRVYLVTMRRIKLIQVESLENEDLKTNRLLLYPILLFAIYLPPIISRLLNIIGYDPPSIEAAMTFISHSIGLMNALIYGCLRKAYFVSRSTQKKSVEIESGGELH